MTKPVILCVDDEKMVLDSLETQLYTEFGAEYTVLLAESGEEAWEILTECQASQTEIAVIITDYLMPGMNGVRLLEQAQQQFAATLKIMLTGKADLTAVIQAVNQADLYRYIAKPWEKNDLLLTVREALTRYRMQQTIRTQNEELQAINNALEVKITERTRELSLQKELFRQVFTNAPEAMALFNRETVILEVNPAFETLFNYQADAIKGARLERIVPGEWRPESLLLIKEIFAGKVVRRETTRLKQDGQVLPVELHAYAINPEQQRKGGIVVYKDLTLQRQTEKMLRLSYERRRRSNFLNDLATKTSVASGECLSQAQLLGMDLSGAWSVYYINPVATDEYTVATGMDAELADKVLQDEAIDWLSEQTDWYAWNFRDGIGLIVRRAIAEQTDLASEKQIGLTVVRRLQSRFPKVRFVLGVTTDRSGWEHFGVSCRQARSTVLIGMKLYPEVPVHHYWDFGAFSVMTKMMNDPETEDFLERTLGNLLRHDTAKGTELFITLKQILAHENLRVAADALFIHYKTALFRKQAIEKILGVSLDSFEGRTTLTTALILYYVRELQDQL